MLSDEAVRDLLGWAWGLGDGVRVARHDGGMGSQTWIVDLDGRRWVAKSVAPHLADSFASGLQVALLLGEAGISAGAPVPAQSGPVSVDAASGDRVALLTWVPGSPLTGADKDEQILIGETLARVHRVVRGRTVPGAQAFHWSTRPRSTSPCARGSGPRSARRSTRSPRCSTLGQRGRWGSCTPTPPPRPSGTMPLPGAAASSTGAPRITARWCTTLLPRSCTWADRIAPSQ